MISIDTHVYKLTGARMDSATFYYRSSVAAPWSMPQFAAQLDGI